MAASERSNFIESNAAKDKKKFFNISIRLIVIDEIRQISRKKLDFAKLTEARPKIS